MFGVIVSGRLAQTDFVQVSETQFITTIPEADNIHHIVVFLTGIMPFPEGMGGQVFFSWPDPNAPPNWQPLGYITNMKPSAIFKISSLKKLRELMDFSNTAVFGQQAICHNAQIGISIENSINFQEPRTDEQAANYATFAEKMLENFMNFALSYSTNQFQDPSTTYVPMSTVQNWYTNFKRRLTQNPTFWKN